MLYLIAFAFLVGLWVYKKSNKKLGAKSITIIKTTFASQEGAMSVCQNLCQSKLVACGNVYEIKSCYMWSGFLQKEGEFALELKTHNLLASKVVLQIQKHHQYKTPQIVYYQVKTTPEYYLWLASCLEIEESPKKSSPSPSKQPKTVEHS